ncbi:MAG TPA: class I SAM-dependent methyltransferase [Pyrinomonadaceae bacterium]|nr:class I SAM-dependent methyltransferase [Pyrinomonadaceae bacterium]
MDSTEATLPRARADEEAVSIYDRFTHLYDLMFRVNGYGRSLERYLKAKLPELPAGAPVLDAGCGTGLLTLALTRVLQKPASINAVDLSHSSLRTARRAVFETGGGGARHRVSFARADALRLPFPDEAFQLVATSGVLEYLPLREGLKELARVLRPGGYFFHLPVVPSVATRLLELMFRFKAHPPSEVAAHTERHFRVIERHHFAPLEPIGWTKIAVLAQKP